MTTETQQNQNQQIDAAEVCGQSGGWKDEWMALRLPSSVFRTELTICQRVLTACSI